MPIDALSVSCSQLTHDLLAIAKFLFLLHELVYYLVLFKHPAAGHMYRFSEW